MFMSNGGQVKYWELIVYYALFLKNHVIERILHIIYRAYTIFAGTSKMLYHLRLPQSSYSRVLTMTCIMRFFTGMQYYRNYNQHLRI